MGAYRLTQQGFTKEIEDVSTGPHPRKFCFILGAGASRSSGIKSGQEFVDIWDEEIKMRNPQEYSRWKKELGITEENKYSFYSKYYEKRFPNPQDGYNYLEKLMERAKPSPGYVMLSYLLTKTNHNVVITTNFDHLIEDAVRYYTQELPLVIGHEALAHYVEKNVTRPTVIKIHRDLLFNPENRTDEVETLHKNWQTALDVIFQEYNPIFIGYAGNDNSLMNFLLENSSKFSSGEWKSPYWLLYKEEKKPNEKVSDFLERSDGYFIRHDGFDEILYFISAAFNYKMPSEEDFLNDARKRYQALAHAIDEYTDKLLSGKSLSSPDSELQETGADEIGQAMQKITAQADLQNQYRQAVSLNNSGKYGEALQIKQELVKLEPENARYHYSLGITLHKMKRYEEALAETQKAIKLEPANADYYNNLGVTLHEMKHYEEALTEIQRAVELEPEGAQYHGNLGVTLYKIEQYDKAEDEFQKALTLLPQEDESRENILEYLRRIEEKRKGK